MNCKKLNNKIRHRKALLNILLLFLKRTNPIVVIVSQNLDYFIQYEQNLRFAKYYKNNKSNKIA